MGRNCSCLLPKQDGGTSQILVKPNQGLQADGSPCIQGELVVVDLGWLRFGMFHHPAWAEGIYRSGPPARGTPQIQVNPTKFREEMGHPVHIHAICHIFSMCSLSMANVSSLFNIFSITRHNIWIRIELRVLVVRAIVLQRTLPPSFAICVTYVITTFFRSLEWVYVTSVAPWSREVLITVASGMRTSWRRPSLPLRTRAHHEPSRPPCAVRTVAVVFGTADRPFHSTRIHGRHWIKVISRTNIQAHTFYHCTKRVTNWTINVFCCESGSPDRWSKDQKAAAFVS